MPVHQLTSEMTYEEFLGWLNYFERRPLGWREDDRTVKLLQVQGVKEKPWALFRSLDAIYNPPSSNKGEGNFDANNFKRSGFFQKLASASGGESIL
jgi:hypothetical protein